MSLVNLFFNLIKRQFKPIEIDEIDQHFIKRQYFDIIKYCIKKLFHAFPPSFTYWKTCCLNSPVERQDRNTSISCSVLPSGARLIDLFCQWFWQARATTLQVQFMAGIIERYHNYTHVCVNIYKFLYTYNFMCLFVCVFRNTYLVCWKFT